MTIEDGNYNYWLVGFSLVLAMVASYAALELAGRVSSARGRTRVAWLGGGAIAMGCGICAMHYVGLFAGSVAARVSYHLPTVALSLVAAILASAVALFFVSRPKMDVPQTVLGSVGMGSGLAGAHYIGLSAMRGAAKPAYDSTTVALSMGLAIPVSAIALQLAFRLRDEKGMTWRKIMSAVITGGLIPAMHYSGKWAESFQAASVAPDLTHAVPISTMGIVAIGVASIFVLAVAIASSAFDRLKSVQRDTLGIARERELYFKTMAEAVPEILWTADLNGADDYFNQKTIDYTGRSHEQMRGDGWYQLVHPDDLEDCIAKWKNALSTGEPYEVEYRLRAKDGSFRWFLGRANPIRNSAGAIVKWFGTCTDIENQKHNQQILEEQILERTAELADLNSRLQEEMLEKDFARKELDQQNEKMMSELEQRSQRATMLAKMGELLQSCISREEVFAAALGFAPKVFPNARGAVALLNAARSTGEVMGSWNDCVLPAMDFDLTACWALRTGHSHLVPAGDNTARCAHAGGVKQTYLCVPILAQGETLGILHLQATEESRHLSAAELAFSTASFAGQIGLSIANLRLREALRTQSVRDALTGLFNRRYLEEILDRETRRAGRAGQSMGILLLDLDHFKNYNDTYGHEAGDTVLRETAALLSKNVRSEDFVCRFGGEEFVVVLPTADLQGARARAERLCARMRELTIIQQGKLLGMITISVGVAEFPRHGLSPKELMAAADRALYEAKRGGRDRVAVAAAKRVEGSEIADAKAAATNAG